ncbi:MAG TPA: hypothetical protein PK265_02765 [Candidatus Saccharibacteria bacterium]|nr:hypothetical protein [Candidatus Saccharibacteria bacterium]HRQ98220.1 hypothetical protein [Candidatus Saccharibacteria bacterium]
MPRFYFEKLVRDKILDRSLDDAEVLHVEYRLLGEIDKKQELIKKIIEEVDEIPITPELTDDVLGEIADVQATVDALCKAYGITKNQLTVAIEKKADKNGGFEKGAYIEYVDLSDKSEWVDIFRKQPDKYREEEL